jgi:hypothetical protein
LFSLKISGSRQQSTLAGLEELGVDHAGSPYCIQRFANAFFSAKGVPVSAFFDDRTAK